MFSLDICIVCCQPQVKIILQHPLFVGGVCQTCKKCITNVTKMEAGKIHVGSCFSFFSWGFSIY